MPLWKQSVFQLCLLTASASASTVDFQREIQPIFQQRCTGCHNGERHIANLRLDDRESARRVLDSGLLLEKIKTTMPPVGAKLTPDQVALIGKWMSEGAVWPVGLATAKHWAWEPVARPKAPAENAIDYFASERLHREGLEFSPEADRATLLRRVSLDLTGLPPTPAETAAFLADKQQDSYARQVDRLLASPHYGEKFARYWLDLAHYADSDGFEKDLVRPWSWRYRDWVINAYNADMPYDRFVTLQIAGDELGDPIPTGFYRNTLTNRESGVDRREARFDQLVDRVGATGTVFMGITVRCSQCHDHKYDPIKQRDFYKILAYFNAADEADREDAPSPEYLNKRTHLLEYYGIAPLQEQWEQDMVRAMDDPGKELDWDFQVTEMRSGFDHADRILHTPATKRTQQDLRRLTNRFLKTPGPRIGADKALAAKIKDAREKLDALDKLYPVPAVAYVMEDRSDYGPAHIALRGDYKNPGDEVQPGVPAFLPGSAKPAPTRRDLAAWILAPENPLTARVAANRVWQQLFGRGIVSTSEDFGTQGDKPSHPELLDWLATEYRALGWSQKALIREIVLSRTYRQSSNARPELERKDPENVLLARQSRIRMPAELIRDSALQASGLLDPHVGGPSIKPFQPAGVAELGYGALKKWVESPGTEKYRRGLYIHYQRTTPYPFLANFDAPDSTLSCTRRRVSDTALQALDLLNDPVFFEAAQALALRIETEPTGSFQDRLDYAYRLTLDRAPTEKETARLAAYFDTQSGIRAKEPDAIEPWVGISRILLNLDEFITRE